jgi:hypothetical protein
MADRDRQWSDRCQSQCEDCSDLRPSPTRTVRTEMRLLCVKAHLMGCDTSDVGRDPCFSRSGMTLLCRPSPESGENASGFATRRTTPAGRTQIFCPATHQDMGGPSLSRTRTSQLVQGHRRQGSSRWSNALQVFVAGASNLAGGSWNEH